MNKYFYSYRSVVFGVAACIAFSDFARASDSIFNYAVYTSSGIEAECSDFLGQVASGGAVMFRDFLVQGNNPRECALESAHSVQMTRGKIATSDSSYSSYGYGNLSCVGADSFSNEGGEVGQAFRPRAPFSELNQQVVDFSKSLTRYNSNANRMVKVMRINSQQVTQQRTITLSGSSSTLLVVTSNERDVSLYGVGIKLRGSIGPKNIVWNFPNARSVVIANSGMDEDCSNKGWGIPGTVVAPYAKVTFNNARITGALFAAAIYGKADQYSCGGVVSGQVNGECLAEIIPGIGCGDGGSDDGSHQEQQQQEPQQQQQSHSPRKPPQHQQQREQRW